MNNMQIKEQEKQQLLNCVAYADQAITRDYLNYLPELKACPDSLEESGQNYDEELTEYLKNSVSLLTIEKIIYARNENNLQKLTSVYAAAHAAGKDLLMLLHSDGKTAELYLGTVNDNEHAEVLYSAINGNFPGSLPPKLRSAQVPDGKKIEILNAWMDKKDKDHKRIQGRTIVSVSVVPDIRTENDEDNEKNVQGLERILDAMHGEPFTMVILAKRISPEDLSKIKSDYETLYSELSPYAKCVLNYGQSETQSVSESLAHSFTETVGTSTSKTLTVGSFNSKAESEGKTKTKSASILKFSWSRSKTLSNAVTAGQSESTGNTSGEQKSSASGKTDTDTHGSSTGTSLNRQLEYHNKSIEELLSRIDLLLKRIQESECYGMFGVSSYFIAESEDSALRAASAYRGIVGGRNSHVDPPRLNTWRFNGQQDKNDSDIMKQQDDNYSHIMGSLCAFHHPEFFLGDEDSPRVTPSTMLSGRELAIAMGLPKKSIPGVEVIETVPFGRNVHSIDSRGEDSDKFTLGNVYHMWAVEATPVQLDKNSMSSHTFITGSTGTGKSNTIYRILDKLSEAGVHFLVIEPAKGEYKNVFGGHKDMTVYGTNPKMAQLLKLNPFSFPDEIHVLEHIDRLIEIFNACWPMYAAMPAVLKDAIEASYRNHGWDMELSVNPNGTYPTFSDILTQLPKTIEESNYSADTQSDYVGALVTRVKSLTNGIVGQIFCSHEETSNEALFDSNTIIDLSRVGSSETKALLMGLLTMKLQEYRMSQGGMNLPLKHITVLEEAHNLLRRTSSEQSQDSSNLQGKAVEMIANAIAEMRTYGEGFIIADQSPGLMDMSVIRNTNTKIILRLPDEGDRQLVGKAASLSDAQILELARLPKGVAAVYQSDWIEPILCKVKRFEVSETPYSFQYANQTKSFSKFFKILLNTSDSPALEQEDVDRLSVWIRDLNEPSETKEILKKVINGVPISSSERKVALYNLFKGRQLARNLELSEDDQAAISSMDLSISRQFYLNDDMNLAHQIRTEILSTVLSQMEGSEFRKRFHKFI